MSAALIASALRRRLLPNPHRLHPKHLSTFTLPLTHPSVVVWGSNTGVGKTLISTGLAASSLSSPSPSPSKFTYIKPVQTGFPIDSDSQFLYRKVSQLFQRRRPPRVLFASNHVMRGSSKVCEGVLSSEEFGGGRDSCKELRELGFYEERKLEGEGVVELRKSVLVCETICAWRDGISPHLAVEREGGGLEDAALLEMVGKCLRRGLKWDGEEGGKGSVMCVVETAGGVASPGPSGTLQCDLYRYEALVHTVDWF